MSQQTHDRGFVSLLTAIFISLLLVIVATGIISIETLQLRKSEDAEQSLRAYYAAEAGVEDAVAKILSGVPIGAGCNQNLAFDAGGEQWTCQQVSLTGSPSGKFSAPDTAVTIDPGTVGPPNYKSMIIAWGQSNNPGGYNVNLAGGLPCDSRNLTACPANGYNALGYSVPPMEVAVVQYPQINFSATSGGLSLQNALLVPAGNAPPITGAVNAAALPNHGPWLANCGVLGRPLPAPYGGNASYNCYAVFQNLSGGSDYLFRIRTRYQVSQYQMTFWTSTVGTGLQIQVPTGMAMIDVTARAGTEYRRVISQLPLNPSAAAELNYVIYSDTDICKDFDVINNNPPANGCPYP